MDTDNSHVSKEIQRDIFKTHPFWYLFIKFPGRGGTRSPLLIHPGIVPAANLVMFSETEICSLRLNDRREVGNCCGVCVCESVHMDWISDHTSRKYVYIVHMYTHMAYIIYPFVGSNMTYTSYKHLFTKFSQFSTHFFPIFACFRVAARSGRRQRRRKNPSPPSRWKRHGPPPGECWGRTPGRSLRMMIVNFPLKHSWNTKVIPYYNWKKRLK